MSGESLSSSSLLFPRGRAGDLPFQNTRIVALTLSRVAMSQVPDCLAPTQDDIAKLLACDSHTGSTNCDKNMTRYVHKRRGDGASLSHSSPRFPFLIQAPQVCTSSTSSRPGRSWFWLPVLSPLLTTLLMFALSLLELMVNVLSSSTLT